MVTGFSSISSVRSTTGAGASVRRRAADTAELSPPARVVVDRLGVYAERGIFRGFGHRLDSRGRLELRFLWHAEEPHTAVFDPSRLALTFRDLLPEVPFRSEMDRALRRFVADHSSPLRPEHRRLDPARATARVVNRNNRASIEVLAVSPDQIDYAVQRGVKLVNEIFFGFLAGPYAEYMIRIFKVPEE